MTDSKSDLLNEFFMILNWNKNGRSNLTDHKTNTFILCHYRRLICPLNTQQPIQRLFLDPCRQVWRNPPTTMQPRQSNRPTMFSNCVPKLLSYYCFLLSFLCLYICCKLYKTVVNAAKPANAVATSDNVTSAATFKKIDPMHIPKLLLSTWFISDTLFQLLINRLL